MLNIRLDVVNSTRGSKRPILAFVDEDGNVVVECADLKPLREKLVADWLAEAHRCMDAQGQVATLPTVRAPEPRDTFQAETSLQVTD